MSDLNQLMVKARFHPLFMDVMWEFPAYDFILQHDPGADFIELRVQTKLDVTLSAVTLLDHASLNGHPEYAAIEARMLVAKIQKQVTVN